MPASLFKRGSVAAAQTHGALPAATGIIGETPAMHVLRRHIERLAPISANILIVGETGTGKELTALRLHELSGRAGPFVALNCGAISSTLFETELFGHQSGAFTGATKTTMGKIEQSSGGTLFLDEIESMPLAQQVALLRVLETREVERLGARSTIALDLRVVTASKVSLAQRCAEGSFREDLYHRLNTVPLSIPALRERREDIPALFNAFYQSACEKHKVRVEAIDLATLARLMAHHWPGNVRELKHAAERKALAMPMLGNEPTSEVCQPQSLTEMMSAYERELVRLALSRHPRNLAGAAAELGVSEKTLSRRMQDFGLVRSK